MTDPNAGRNGSTAGSNGSGNDAIAGTPVVLYQTGGFGIEPVMYLLAADAPRTAALVRELV